MFKMNFPAKKQAHAHASALPNIDLPPPKKVPEKNLSRIQKKIL